MKASALKTLLALIFLINFQAIAQSNLEKRISISIEKQKLGIALNTIAQKGNFIFSYNNAIIRRDSIVTLHIQNKSVREILHQLFNDQFEYKEMNNYVIINGAWRKLSLNDYEVKNNGNFYLVSGYVVDDQTGKKLENASVYEKQLLVATLTDKNGYFVLKIKNIQKQTIDLTASKYTYRDTTVMILHEVTVRPGKYRERENGGYDTDSSRVERTFMGEFLLSSKQSIQSLNLAGFFANRPFQASLTPGLSSHGMMSAQVVNKFSLNILGGYTAGVDGFELAGLFNINKKSTRYFQAAGLFNTVGGSVHGFQLAGLNNTVLDSVNGVQLTGLYNLDKSKFNGFQLSGLSNHVYGDFNGVQLTGLINRNNSHIRGFQLAGLANISRTVNGMQMVGVLNYAKELRGFQFGLINVADSSSGCSFGLLNFIKDGYLKVSLGSNEVTNATISIKTGNAKLYTVLLGGANLSDDQKAYSMGLGFGHDFLFSKRTSLSAELTSQIVYLGSWDNLGNLTSLRTTINVALTKNFALFAGPTFNVNYSDTTPSFPDYKTELPRADYHTFKVGSSATGWIGWNVGITLF